MENMYISIKQRLSSVLRDEVQHMSNTSYYDVVSEDKRAQRFILYVNNAFFSL